VNDWRSRVEETLSHDTPRLVATRSAFERALFYRGVTVALLRLKTLQLATDTAVSQATLQRHAQTVHYRTHNETN